MAGSWPDRTYTLAGPKGDDIIQSEWRPNRIPFEFKARESREKDGFLSTVRPTPRDAPTWNRDVRQAQEGVGPLSRTSATNDITIPSSSFVEPMSGRSEKLRT